MRVEYCTTRLSPPSQGPRSSKQHSGPVGAEHVDDISQMLFPLLFGDHLLEHAAAGAALALPILGTEDAIRASEQANNQFFDQQSRSSLAEGRQTSCHHALTLSRVAPAHRMPSLRCRTLQPVVQQAMRRIITSRNQSSNSNQRLADAKHRLTL